MSFDKNISYKNSWLSQFGLYRYENTSRQNRYSYWNFGLLGIIGVFIALFALIVVLASNLTIINETTNQNDGIPKRIIIIATNDTSSQSPSFGTPPTTLRPSKTTLQYLNHQIYKISDLIDNIPSNNDDDDERLKKTTPMTPNHKVYSQQHQSNGLLFDQNIDENHENLMTTDDISMGRSIESLELRGHQPYSKYIQPKMNRRKIDENLDEPRPFDYYLLKGTPPSAFQINKLKKNKLTSLFPPSYTNDEKQQSDEQSLLQSNQPSLSINPLSISFPDIPKDYSGAVSSIQDIIKQLRTDQAINNDSNENHLSLPELLERNGRKIRFGGTYRHRKNRNGTRSGRGRKFNHHHHHQHKSNESSLVIKSLQSQRPLVAQLLPPLSSQLVPAKTLSKIVKDPFYQYKPQSLSDINLLAIDKFRLSPPNMANLLLTENKPTVIHDPSDPAQLYQQIISVNNQQQRLAAAAAEAEAAAASGAGQSDDYILESDRQNSRNGHGNGNIAAHKKKTKPFQLMLDVYPMIDDDLPASIVQPTRRTPQTISSYPSKLRKPIMMQIPSYFQPPSIVNAINNLPLHLENQYFQNMNFPQVNYNRASIESQNNYHNLMVKKFPQNHQQLINGLPPPNHPNHNNQRQHYPNHHHHQQQQQHHQQQHQSQQSQQSQQSEQSQHPQQHQFQQHQFHQHQNENTPSQITVHLNLFPKNKHNHESSSSDLRKSDKQQVILDELNVSNSDLIPNKFHEYDKELDSITDASINIKKTNEKIDKGGLLAVKTMDTDKNKLTTTSTPSTIVTDTDMTTMFNDLLTERMKNNQFITDSNLDHEQDKFITTTDKNQNQLNDGYVNFYKNINFMYTTTIPIEPRDYVEIPTLTRGGLIPQQLPEQIVVPSESDEILK